MKSYLFILLIVGVFFNACFKKEAEPGGQDENHWSYTGNADPTHWAELSSEFVRCAEGHIQSPIDIESYKVKTKKTHSLTFNYHLSHVDAVNNGHTIQANLEEENSLFLNNKQYRLQQIHFHEPSEHHLNGIIYPMEIHMVHTDSNGKLVVVGIFVQEGPENQVLRAIWEHLPEKKEMHYHPDRGLDLVHLLPEDHSVYHYVGSLTTPPCSEGVEWLIMRTPVALSKEQIARFQHLYHGNNRPIQALHDREVEVLAN